MIGSVKKQMFRVGKCALDLTMAFRKFDLTRPGANPNVKSGLLDATEFNRALADVGIFVSQAECAALVRQFGEGTGEDGFIQYEVFGECLRDGISDRRADLIKRVYWQIDSHLPRKMVSHPVTGVLTEQKADMTMEFLLSHYHAEMHPMVRAGEISADEALRQMKDGLENGPMDADGDGCVDEDEFLGFYGDISAGIPSDDYFCYVCECVWNIEEVPDANPIDGFKRERPRRTPAMKDALYEARTGLPARMTPR